MNSDTLVIGAGPAGLAVAGCLVQQGLQPQVIDEAQEVASSWRAHYEHLHLHTVKSHSALPGVPFAKTLPRYVPRQAVVDYMAAYAGLHQIKPDFGERAVAITPQSGGWKTTTQTGRHYVSSSVVLATGANRHPRVPVFPNQASFTGKVLHSHAYRDASLFIGQRVLVVGMGNTGAEIALDLVAQGVRAALSVRSPLNIVYRDILGRPTQLTAMALARLPSAWGDAAARVVRDLTVGDLTRWGIRTSPMSPMKQLREHGKTPLIDIGTLARIKRGDIKVHPGIEMFTKTGLRFLDGSESNFDAVILATGYEARINQLFPETPVVVDANGMPCEVVGSGAMAGVYFVGFDLRKAGGVLRTIGLQARQVASEINAST